MVKHGEHRPENQTINDRRTEQNEIVQSAKVVVKEATRRQYKYNIRKDTQLV